MGSGEQPGGSRDAPSGLEAGGERGPACGTWRALGSRFWEESITCLLLLGREGDSCSSLCTDPSSAPSKGLGVVRRPSGLREEEAPGSATACLEPVGCSTKDGGGPRG